MDREAATLHARINDAFERQHAIWEQRIWPGVALGNASMACMHGADAAGAPTQRTLTSENARAGTTACANIATSTISLAKL